MESLSSSHYVPQLGWYCPNACSVRPIVAQFGVMPTCLHDYICVEFLHALPWISDIMWVMVSAIYRWAHTGEWECHLDGQVRNWWHWMIFSHDLKTNKTNNSTQHALWNSKDLVVVVGNIFIIYSGFMWSIVGQSYSSVYKVIVVPKLNFR